MEQKMNEFPKMLYRNEQLFEDQEALKRAVHDRTLKTLVVESGDEQKVAVKKGWTEDLASLVKAEPKAESEAK
jgi:hypothetical protein